MLDCFSQNLIDGGEQLLRARTADVPCCRLDSCTEQSFIRINIAYSAEDRLVEKHGLDMGFSLELLWRKLCKRVGTKPLDTCGTKLDSAEHPGVVIMQHGIIEDEDDSRV